MKIDLNTSMIISVISSIITAVLLFIFIHPVLSIEYGVFTDDGLNNLIIISSIAGLTPLAAYSEYRHRFDRRVEKSLSTLFSILSEGVRSGLSLIDSIARAGDSLRGPVGDVCREVARKAYMGIDFSDALTLFPKRLGRYGKSVKNIIMSAYIGGGDVETAFDNASKAYIEYEKYKAARIEEIRPILFTSYISLMVLLIIAYVLMDYFLPGVYGMGGLLRGMQASIGFYKAVMLWMCIFIDLSSPILFSKIAYGDPRTGVKHVVIMLVITYIFFNYILPFKIPMNIPGYRPLG